MFTDRVSAGRLLAEALDQYRDAHPLAIGLPRGGVVVAAEVAKVLGAPLDIAVVRKLGTPGQPELGMGAIGEEGVRILNHDLIEQLGITDSQITAVEQVESIELERRARAYRNQRPPLPAEGHTAIVIDDGIATGYTARAAVHVLRKRGASRVVLAVPVGARETVRFLEEDADRVLCLLQPTMMWAIGAWYQDFTQVSDEEVIQLLGAQAAAKDATS